MTPVFITNTNRTAIPYYQYYVCEKAFNPAECDAIITLGLRMPLEEGTISKKRIIDETMRKSHIRWFSYENPEYSWIWTKLLDMGTEINKQCFNFDLVACFDMIQFTAYDEQGSHYDWHMDCGEGNLSRRKLSMTLQLSNPESYAGGNLELLYSRGVTPVERKRGTLVVFPSYTLHRVTPVTAGVRYSLVLWMSGSSPYR